MEHGVYITFQNSSTTEFLYSYSSLVFPSLQVNVYTRLLLFMGLITGVAISSCFN
jgi:hypothetical protein